MRRFIYLILMVVLFTGCDKDSVIDDVFISQLDSDSDEVLADGQTIITLSVQLSDKSSSDRRSVIFKASSGIFIGSDKNINVVKAEFENKILVAKAKLKAPIEPGVITVSVMPEYDSPLKEFVREKQIQARPSIPAKIKLASSSFGIGSNFINEVLVIGTLENSEKSFVSKGYSVLFEDFLLGGTPAGGRFRNINTTTRDSSRVTVYYSARSYSVGTVIILKGIILSNDGNKTSLSDTLTITVNQ